MVIFHSYVKLPEGNHNYTHQIYRNWFLGLKNSADQPAQLAQGLHRVASGKVTTEAVTQQHLRPLGNSSDWNPTEMMI